MQNHSDDLTLLQRFTRNAIVILRARFVFGLLNLLSAAIAWRAVGAEAFGVIVLLQAYTRLITNVCRLPTWALVARYGPGTIEADDHQSLGRLLGFTIRLDILGFALAIAVMIFAAPLFARWMQFTPEATALVPVFAISAPFIVMSTASGLLQLFERMSVLAGQHALNAVLRFAGVCAVYLLAGGLTALIIVWVVATVLSGLYMIAKAAGELRSRRVAPRLLGSWRTLTDGFENIWRFSIIINGNSAIERVVLQLTVMLVAAQLGTAAAGLFGIVRQITESIGKLGTTLAPVIFPHVALLATRDDRVEMRRILGRILLTFGAVLCALIVILTLGGEFILVTLFDSTAAPGAPLLTVMGAAASIVVLGFALEPIMFSIGKDRELILLTAVVTAIFVILALVGMNLFGLIGVGLAIFFRQFTIFAGRLLMVRSYFRG